MAAKRAEPACTETTRTRQDAASLKQRHGGERNAHGLLPCQFSRAVFTLLTPLRAATAQAFFVGELVTLTVHREKRPANFVTPRLELLVGGPDARDQLGNGNDKLFP